MNICRLIFMIYKRKVVELYLVYFSKLLNHYLLPLKHPLVLTFLIDLVNKWSGAAIQMLSPKFLSHGSRLQATRRNSFALLKQV